MKHPQARQNKPKPPKMSQNYTNHALLLQNHQKPTINQLKPGKKNILKNTASLAPTVTANLVPKYKIDFYKNWRKNN